MALTCIVLEHSCHSLNVLSAKYCVAAAIPVESIVLLVLVYDIMLYSSQTIYIFDRFGRQLTIITFLIFGSLCGIAAAFSVNIYMFAALRFIIAACFTGTALLAHCISKSL